MAVELAINEVSVKWTARLQGDPGDKFFIVADGEVKAGDLSMEVSILPFTTLRLRSEERKPTPQSLNIQHGLVRSQCPPEPANQHPL